jgi:hypothetical protein
MPTARVAWWTRPGSNSPEIAAALLIQFRPAIEGRIAWYARKYPGEVDWEPVVWDAAYRTAFCAYDGRFWTLFTTVVWQRTQHSIERHFRRKGKLMRHSLDEIEEPAW